jgi:hypothetical protein
MLAEFISNIVIPAKAGIHFSAGDISPTLHNPQPSLGTSRNCGTVDPGLRRDDGLGMA